MINIQNKVSVMFIQMPFPRDVYGMMVIINVKKFDVLIYKIPIVALRSKSVFMPIISVQTLIVL